MSSESDTPPGGYVLCGVLFLRNGTARTKLLARGSKAECAREAALIEGVIVNPDGDVTEAYTFVWPAHKWQAFERRVKERAARRETATTEDLGL